ncbi:hypothetical protein DFH09DRAFT_1198659 [Mycena vulgaris]|nr:hypothetical protein DFH09DRAFT_1198659 [Mycena vulgaris]
MRPSTILFHPYSRVWSLRLLLLSSLATALYWTIDPVATGAASDAVLYFPASICAAAIFVHHIVVIFKWPLRVLAVVDLVIVALEIGGMTFAVLVGGPLLCINVGLLIVSACFRIATIDKSEGGIWGQRFDFLGSCTTVYPPYTPLSIILNRSLARPLVRGESRTIMVVRAIILTLIILGVPGVAVYTVVVVPMKALVYIRTSYIRADFSDWKGATIYLDHVPFDPDFEFVDLIENIRVSGYVLPGQGEGDKFNCGIETQATTVKCSGPWPNYTEISISVTFESWLVGVYVRVAQDTALSTLDLGEPTLLVPGSHLSGLLLWRKREIITGPSWGLRAYKSVLIGKLTSFQPNSFADASMSNVSTLNLLQPSPKLIPLIQDTVDPSVLSGIATFGGFWTFVNGAFALFFGANVVYFVFGRRPLSALGLVHVFQRRGLVRRWHEDFPAIHTEGGAPGSESAGIVAFIRERLVDLGEDPRALSGEQDGLESRIQRETISPHERSLSLRSSDSEMKEETVGYGFDKVPLLDMDLRSTKLDGARKEIT